VNRGENSPKITRGGVNLITSKAKGGQESRRRISAKVNDERRIVIRWGVFGRGKGNERPLELGPSLPRKEGKRRGRKYKLNRLSPNSFPLNRSVWEKRKRS